MQKSNISEHNYTEPCLSTTECDTSAGLFCQTIPGACNCPNISVIGMCDCDEKYYFSYLEEICGMNM